jgi:hypothetical protein
LGHLIVRDFDKLDRALWARDHTQAASAALIGTGCCCDFHTMHAQFYSREKRQGSERVVIDASDVEHVVWTDLDAIACALAPGRRYEWTETARRRFAIFTGAIRVACRALDLVGIGPFCVSLAHDAWIGLRS